jgi:DNA-binding IclR family transcriptional regulator
VIEKTPAIDNVPSAEARDTAPSRFNTARRAFRVLDLISQREGTTAKCLSKELGVSLSTCYCLINVLLEEGFVEKIPQRKGYRLGPAVPLLYARAHSRDVDARVEPVVEELACRANRHAYLGLLSDRNVTMARISHPRTKPPVELVKADSGASHALAVGKILIASAGPDGLEGYVESHGLERFTTRTITDPRQLNVHLSETLRRGYAADLEEFSENLCCVAAPITAEGGKVEGAVGISTTARHFYKESSTLISLVQRYAREASLLLGG